MSGYVCVCVHVHVIDNHHIIGISFMDCISNYDVIILQKYRDNAEDCKTVHQLKWADMKEFKALIYSQNFQPFYVCAERVDSLGIMRLFMIPIITSILKNSSSTSCSIQWRSTKIQYPCHCGMEAVNPDPAHCMLLQSMSEKTPSENDIRIRLPNSAPPSSASTAASNSLMRLLSHATPDFSIHPSVRRNIVLMSAAAERDWNSNICSRRND